MRRLVSLLLALLLVLSVPAYATGEDTAAQRQEDLDTLYETLKESHPNLFANTSEEAFLAKKAEIESRLASVDDATFALDLQSLVAMVGDSRLHPLVRRGLGGQRPAGRGGGLSGLDH